LKRRCAAGRGGQCRICEGSGERRYGSPAGAIESVSLIAFRHHAKGRSMDLWLQILFGIILIGIAIELAYIGQAISVTNKRLSALLKHINPQ
jgi:hypothetical protein